MENCVTYKNGVTIKFPAFQCHCALIGDHIYLDTGFFTRRDRIVTLTLQCEDVQPPAPGKYYMERQNRAAYTHLIRMHYYNDNQQLSVCTTEIRGEDSALHFISDLINMVGDGFEPKDILDGRFPECSFVRQSHEKTQQNDTCTVCV